MTEKEKAPAGQEREEHHNYALFDHFPTPDEIDPLPIGATVLVRYSTKVYVPSQ